jgi:hypothetical protein
MSEEINDIIDLRRVPKKKSNLPYTLVMVILGFVLGAGAFYIASDYNTVVPISSPVVTQTVDDLGIVSGNANVITKSVNQAYNVAYVAPSMVDVTDYLSRSLDSSEIYIPSSSYTQATAQANLTVQYNIIITDPSDAPSWVLAPNEQLLYTNIDNNIIGTQESETSVEPNFMVLTDLKYSQALDVEPSMEDKVPIYITVTYKINNLGETTDSCVFSSTIDYVNVNDGVRSTMYDDSVVVKDLESDKIRTKEVTYKGEMTLHEWECIQNNLATFEVTTAML